MKNSATPELSARSTHKNAATEMNIRSALREAMTRLESAGVPSHALAAELLLMHALERDRTSLYTYPEDEIPLAALEKFQALIAQRAAGAPTQYLTGKQEFWGLDFEVTHAVLIPRPETEHVIEVTLERLETERKNAPLHLADIGTGSGCLAIALAHELPHAEIIATDISREALEVARRNAARHNAADRIQFVESDLFELFRGDESLSPQNPEHTRDLAAPHKNAGWQPALRDDVPRLDAIVSNPPYIPLGKAAGLQREVRGHEPAIALFAGDDGLAIYIPLIREAPAFLKPRGLLVLELGHNSLPRVRSTLERTRAWSDIRVTNDLAGIPRVISALAAAS
jgi:release factor glutamine methyltransferase